MWAAGVVDLGLAPDYLWSLTPAEYQRLFDVHLAREDRANRRAALIACYIANYAGKMRKEGSAALQMEDILGAPAQPYRGSGNAELDRFRSQAETAVERYVESIRASNPRTEVTLAKAVIGAIDRGGLGQWGKLGTREGLTQPVAIIKAMNPGWKQ